MGNGLVESSTIARNLSASRGGGLQCLAGTVRNCVVSDNSAVTDTNINTTAGVTYSCAPELTGGTSNIAARAIFTSSGSGYGKTAVLGDYRLNRASPGMNAGQYQAWMAGAKDLAGDPRLQNRRVEMGAYETFVFVRGTAVMIR